MLSLILIRRLCCRLASSLQEFGTSFLHYEIMDRTDHLHFYFSNYTTECFVSVGKRIVGYYISLCLAEFWFLPYVTLVFFVSKKRRRREKQTNRRPPKTGIRPWQVKLSVLLGTCFYIEKQNKISGDHKGTITITLLRLKKNLTTHFCYCFDKHYLRDGPACFYPVSAPLQKERKQNHDFASAISET